MIKCAGCNRSVSEKDSVKCTKCSTFFDKPCVQLSRSAWIPPNWTCPGCFSREPRKGNSETPVKGGNSAQTTIEEKTSKDGNKAALVQELIQLSQEMTAIRLKMDQFTERMGPMLAAMSGMDKRLTGVESRLSAIESVGNRICALEQGQPADKASSEDVNALIQTADLFKLQLYDLHQNLLSTDIEITMIPEVRGESPLHLVQLVAGKLGVHLEASDVLSAERVGSPRGQGEQDGAKSRPRPLAVTLARRELCDLLLHEARVRRSVDTSGFDLPGPARRFYVSENFGLAYLRQSGQARPEGKNRGWRYIWPCGGPLYARRQSDSQPQRICTEKDNVKLNATMLGGSVLWFRHGLRLHDNPALHAALEDRSLPFFPLFIFDGETAGTKVVGYNRMRYLLEALDDLDGQFRKHGGRLIMIKGRPKDVIQSLWEEFGINKLCFEQDCEPVWRARDDTVKTACQDIGVTCHEHVSHTLWEPDTVIRANGGIPPLTHQMFLHTVATIGDPPRPVDDVDLTGVQFRALPERFYKEFTVFDKTPKPEDFGVHQENEDVRMIRWTGGETSALRQMKQRLEVEYATFCRGSYLPTHGSPELLGPPISLSPALRFGCLSVRSFYWSIHDLYHQVHQGRLPYTHSITGQLIWREYFYTMSVNNPQYGQMSGNPICLDIPWKEPKGDELKCWTEGRTGFPFIDAAMRQLRIEGWLHHAVRNTVASFLTRGTLWMSWEHGLNHFLKYLLDADWSVCAGNWMWVSSSAFEGLLDTGDCACPVRLGQRLDPSGEYVRRYVPELTNMPDLYIYEPWRAPIEVQERAKCVIGKHYPEPIINHLTAAQRNRNAMKELRQMLEKAPPHCCPSSEDEIRQFMWLYDDPLPVSSG